VDTIRNYVDLLEWVGSGAAPGRKGAVTLD
jgi:hypothetical protein